MFWPETNCKEEFGEFDVGLTLKLLPIALPMTPKKTEDPSLNKHASAFLAFHDLASSH